MVKIKSTNDAWKQLIDEYDIEKKILENGYFKISAESIRELREPRLMVKFDQYNDLPEVLKRKGYTILPISFKEYIIGNFELYFKIEDEYAIKNNIQFENLAYDTLNLDTISSESSAMLFAFNAKIIEDALDTSASFTILGRMRTENFEFDVYRHDSHKKRVGTERISVAGSQIEIDGGFESDEAIYLFETKNRFVDYINLRQLYYPYRFWSSRTTKKIFPVFLVYLDFMFYVFIGEFEDPENMNSFKIIESKKYVISDEPISFENICDIHDSLTPGVSNITFPQADRFEKIIDLMQQLHEKSAMTSKDVTDYFGFNKRQTSYYTDAAIFLDLVVKEDKKIKLSALGKKLVKKKYKEKYLTIVKNMLSDVVFFEVFRQLRTEGKIPNKTCIENLIRKYYPPAKKIDSGTPHRRAQTVIKWIEWINSLTDNY